MKLRTFTLGSIVLIIVNILTGLAPASANSKINYKTGQCQSIDLHLLDKSTKLQYPLTHYQLGLTKDTCERAITQILAHYCKWYPQKRETASAPTRDLSSFLISGKIGFFDQKYQLATVKGSCEKTEVTWRKD